MNVEMIGAHRPLEQSGPQEQRAKYRIDEECRDDDNCPTWVPKPLWPVQFGPLWRSAAIYWPLDLRRALDRISAKEPNVIREPRAQRRGAIAGDGAGIRVHVEAQCMAWTNPLA